MSKRIPRWPCLALLALAACSGQVGGSTVDAPSNGEVSAAPPPSSPTSSESGEASSPGSGATSSPSADGHAARVACTSSFGSALSAQHGRLDGYLTAIVPDRAHSCNGDSQHLHLQVRMSGGVYDVAVNIDGLEAELDASPPGESWSEGWHAGAALDYVKDLSLHAPAFTLSGGAAVRQRVEAALADANHVSIYATGYGPGGVHLVHRQTGARDGAIVIDPLGPKPHVLAFRFDTQSF